MKVVAGVIVDGYYSKDSGIVSRWIPSCGYFVEGAGGDARSRLKRTKTMVWSDYHTSSPKLRSRWFEILETISTVITPPKVIDLPQKVKNLAPN